MTHETGKAVARRLHDSRYQRWISGAVIDIGSGDDPFDRYAGLFPLITSVQLLDAGYDKTAPPAYDQSLMPTCEPAIEFILRKRAIG